MTRTASNANIFQAIADPTRREILNLLNEDERPVMVLCAQFGITQPAVSQHLRVLRAAGLVSERRVGRQRLYRLEAGPLKEVAEWVSHYERFWQGKLDALGEYLDRKR